MKGTYSPQDNPIVNGVLLPPYAGIEVAFTEVSPPRKPFRLCYNFYFSKDEGFKLIDDVYVTVRKITNVNVNIGSNNVSVVDIPRSLHFGNNTLASDRVKWVTGDAVDDADCNNGSALQTPLGGIKGQNVYGSILNVTQYLRYEYFESVIEERNISYVEESFISNDTNSSAGNSSSQGISVNRTFQANKCYCKN